MNGEIIAQKNYYKVAACASIEKRDIPLWPISSNFRTHKLNRRAWTRKRWRNLGKKPVCIIWMWTNVCWKLVLMKATLSLPWSLPSTTCLTCTKAKLYRILVVTVTWSNDAVVLIDLGWKHGVCQTNAGLEMIATCVWRC